MAYKTNSIVKASFLYCNSGIYPTLEKVQDINREGKEVTKVVFVFDTYMDEYGTRRIEKYKEDDFYEAKRLYQKCMQENLSLEAQFDRAIDRADYLETIEEFKEMLYNADEIIEIQLMKYHQEQMAKWIKEQKRTNWVGRVF